MRATVTTALGLAALGVAMGVAGLAAHQAQAQGGGGLAAGGYTQLFVSPAGEPYRAKPGEPYPVALWFKQADTNHDGVITRDEFREDHAGFFHALDHDDAGFLDGPKLAFYEKRVLPDVYAAASLGLNTAPRFGRPEIDLAMARADRDDALLIPAQVVLAPPPDGSHAQDDRAYQGLGAKGPAGEDLHATRPRKKQLIAAAYYGLLNEAEPVRGADANLDGRVTKAEFLAAADRRFKLLDKRQDGRLTLDELPPTQAQIDQERRAKR